MPNEPDPCRMSAIKDTETVPNEIPYDSNITYNEVPDKLTNYGDMTTDLVPSKIR